jgi:2-iminobutanoate/2-iminopropanoate deaminase
MAVRAAKLMLLSQTSMSMSLLHHMIAAGPRPVAPFSHAVEADGWVFVTGQMPTDPAAPDAPLPEGVEAQTKLALQHVTMVRIYLTQFERDYAALNAIWPRFFEPGKLPARTTVGVTALAIGALIEIDLVARRP